MVELLWALLLRELHVTYGARRALVKRRLTSESEIAQKIDLTELAILERHAPRYLQSSGRSSADIWRDTPLDRARFWHEYLSDRRGTSWTRPWYGYTSRVELCCGKPWLKFRIRNSATLPLAKNRR